MSTAPAEFPGFDPVIGPCMHCNKNAPRLANRGDEALDYGDNQPGWIGCRLGARSLIIPMAGYGLGDASVLVEG